MRLGNTTYACDRCAAEKQHPADSRTLPFGWQRMEFPPSYSRDVCPRCVTEFRVFWYQRQAADALAATS